MKYFLIPLLLLFSMTCWGQELKKVAEKKVAYDTKVFTYKVQNSTPSSVQDTQPTTTSVTTQNIVDYFKGLNGVRSAAFDKATQTFTVVTAAQTSIPTNLNFE